MVKRNAKRKLLQKDLKEFIDVMLSHHPPCRCYKNHVFSKKLSVCVGCLFAAIGIILGIALFGNVYYFFNNPLYVVLFAGSLMLISFFSLPLAQSKPLRAVRKFLLGFGMPLYYYTSFAVHWVFVAVFVASIPVYAYVSIKNHEVLEKSCRHKFKPNKRKIK